MEYVPPEVVIINLVDDDFLTTLVTMARCSGNWGSADTCS